MRKFLVWSVRVLIVALLASLAVMPPVMGSHYIFADTTTKPWVFDPSGTALALGVMALAIGFMLINLRLLRLWRRRGQAPPQTS